MNPTILYLSASRESGRRSTDLCITPFNFSRSDLMVSSLKSRHHQMIGYTEGRKEKKGEILNKYLYNEENF